MLARLAKENGDINLRILFRDENEELMDHFLTNGSRSIPKLIAIDEQREVLFEWGPRPETAAELFQKLKAEGWEKEQILLELHKWYAKDRGVSVEAELIAKMGSVPEKTRMESQISPI